MEWLITTANHNLPNLKLIVGEHRGRSSLQGGSDPDSTRPSRDVARLCGGDRRRLALWQRGNIGSHFGRFCLLAY